MGIKNLTAFLKKHAPNSIKEIKITDLSNKIIVIDISILIYQHIIAIKGSGLDLTNKEGIFTSHIQGIISKIIFLTSNKIKPIFVFDGKPSKLKEKTINLRTEAKCKAQEKINEVDEETQIKLSKQCVNIGPIEIDYAKQVIKLLGLPYIEADEEADPQCAFLVRNKIAHGVFTEDMDLLTFGSFRVYRNLSTDKKKPIIEYNLKIILQELDINYPQFIDLCILFGCDYVDTIKGIGKVNAYKLIKEYKKIETILEEKKYQVPDLFDYKSARDYFKNPTGKNLNEGTKWNRPKFEEFKNLLIDKLQFNEKKVDNYITKLKTIYTNSNIFYN
jgi:flap endonuclease-1